MFRNTFKWINSHNSPQSPRGTIEFYGISSLWELMNDEIPNRASGSESIKYLRFFYNFWGRLKWKKTQEKTKLGPLISNKTDGKKTFPSTVTVNFPNFQAISTIIVVVKLPFA